MRNSKGFTLIELMIVVVILGILAAIAIPSFIDMQDRAREGSVKANMHSLQVAVEDFAVQNDGTYPVASDSSAVIALMPGGTMPDNPFTGDPTHVFWGNAAASVGDIGFEIPKKNYYRITGYGADGPLSLHLTNY